MAMEVFRLVGRLTLEGIKNVQNQIKNVGDRAKTIGESFEKVGETVTDSLEEVRDQVEESSNVTRELGETVQKASDTITENMKDTTASVHDYRKAMRQAKREQDQALSPLRGQLLENQKAWFEMGREAKNFQGTTSAFMRQVEALGKQNKKINDAMIANNTLMFGSFLQGVGMMLNRSGQSEKIAQNFERMKNPLYTVNNGLLSITSNLERLARSGAPNVLALKLLGPTASMKELRDMTILITRGQQRFQAVLLASAIAVGVLTTALAKASFGPDPKEVRAQIEEVNAIYEEALAKRKQEIYEWAGLFENVEFKVPNPKSLIDALGEQVKIMRGWTEDLQGLAQRGVDEGFIRELEQLGPKAAPQIHAMIHMTDQQLDEYVKLWRDKQSIASEQALSELEQQRIDTEKQVQKLVNSLEPLGLSVERFKETWGKALEPFVESFGRVASKVVDMGTAIGDFVNKLNETNPMISTVIGWFVYLTAVFTLLLSPLAIGIGLVGGFAAAWAYAAPFIMPLITGLATMSATIWIVVGAILVAIGIISSLVNSFKEWVNGSEEAKQAFNQFVEDARARTEAFLQPLRDLFSSIMEGIKGSVSGVLSEMKAFWDEHGTQVLEAVSTFLDYLLIAWNFVFPVLKFIVEGVIGGIITIIKGFVDVVIGLIKIFSALFTGDWALLWEGLKQTIWGAIQIIWGWLSLSFFGKILKGIGSFVKLAFTSFKGFFTSLINGSKNMVTSISNWFRNLYTRIFNTFIGIRTGVINVMSVIRSTLASIWNSIRSTVTNIVSGMVNAVKSRFLSVYTSIYLTMQRVLGAVTGILGRIKSAFSKLILKIPKPKIPKISVRMASKSIAGVSIPYPDFDLSWNAKGGIWDSASIIGLAENGKEAAIPLEGRHMRPFAEEIANQMPFDVDRGGRVIEVPLFLNDREIARAIVDEMDTTLNRVRQVSKRGRGRTV